MSTRILYTVKFTSTDGKPDLAIFHSRESAEEVAARIGSKVTLHLTGQPDKVKLSEPQKNLLRSFARDGYSAAGIGRINASAWHRTVASLVEMGLVKRSGHQTAKLTWLGLAWAVTL
jgi:hypothetical protein